jgi:hypothetical protein
MTTKLISMLLILGFCSTVSMAQTSEPFDMEACYGDTLELSLIESYAPDSTPIRVVFALPAIRFWSLKPPGLEHPLRDGPCYPEPLVNARAKGFLKKAVQKGALQGSFSEGDLRLLALVDYVRLRSVDPVSFYRSNSLRSIREKFPDLYEIDNGFQKIVGETPENFPGLFLAPKPIRAPNGYRLWFSCSVTFNFCRNGYLLKGNIVLDYEFHTKEIDRSDWVKLDRLLREMVSGWIVQE